MRANINQAKFSVVSLGAVLHQAALASRAIIDAIPDDVSIDDEMSLIAGAIAPVDRIAWMILNTPSLNDEAEEITSRACAWLDDQYWKEAA